MSETVLVNGESVEMTEAERAELGLTPPVEAPAAFAAALTVGVFISRFLHPEEAGVFGSLDDAMEMEPRLIVRQWRNDAAEINAGTGFYDVIAGHLDALVTPERKAELLARP